MEDLFTYLVFIVMMYLIFYKELKPVIRRIKTYKSSIVWPLTFSGKIIHLIILIFSLLIKAVVKLLLKMYQGIFHPIINTGLSQEDLQSIISIVKKMDSRRFEEFCARLFELNGYTLLEITPASNDGGKDIVLMKGYNKIFVECKYYAEHESIGRPIANKLCGVMTQAKIQKGIIITTANNFTKGCKEFCDQVGIETIAMDGIIKMIMKANNKEILSLI